MSSAVEYRERVKAAILDPRFTRATLSAPTPGLDTPWIKVHIRPVRIMGRGRLQVACYDARRCITKNYDPRDAGKEIEVLLALPFRDMQVETTAESLQVHISKQGKASVRSGAPRSTTPPNLSHDREKQQVLPAGGPDPWLQVIGIATRDGAIKAERRRKFTQINEFLAVLDQSLQQSGVGEGATEDRPISVVDCGCGNAYLTFAAYHYFRAIRGLPTRLIGIDMNAELIARQEGRAGELDWTDLRFESTPIAAFVPEAPPDLVMSLHACDTATDDALARAIAWGSKLILCVPCCHHHLQVQLARPGIAPAFRPILRHGVLRERLGDVATDAFRALILRIMGYQTDVMEFVSTEETAKNVLIRAIRAREPGDRRFVREYRALKDALGVTPYLEAALGEPLAAALGAAEGRTSVL